MVLLRGILPAISLLLGGCTTTDPLYCDQNEPCTDPARPFCDLAGEYPASEGVARTCIPDPGAGPGDDAATGGEPDGGGAPSPDGFQLEVSAAIGVEQGRSAPLEVRVVRGEDFADAVTVELTGLPAGVSSGPISIAESSDTGTVEITAASDAPQGGPTAATVSATAGDAMATAEVAVMVRGAPGTLDLSFGTGGSTVLDVRPLAIAVQADGKPIVTGTLGGDAAVRRFSLDGTGDRTFGTGGVLLFSGGSGDVDSGDALALQADGKIVIGGQTDGDDGFDALVARASADGTLDPAFGTDGKVIVDLTEEGGGSEGYDVVALLPDGRIVAAGTLNSLDEDSEVVIDRFDASGEIDSTFGVDGRAVIPSPTQVFVSEMAIQRDGKLVIAGARRIDETNIEQNIMVLRVLPTGSLDSGFGEGGILLLPAPQGGAGTALATSLHLDGDRILVCGISLDDAFVMRLAPDGDLDGAFDGDGFALFSGAEAIWGIHVEPDGKIFAIGTRTAGSGRTGFAGRLTTLGAPDPDFRERTFPLDAGTVHTAFTADGRVVVGGDGVDDPLLRLWR